jgi:REP element-mobilizing transposase RayT
MHLSARKHRVTLLAYALMPNHYHMLAVQQPDGDISAMMEALGTSTAKRFNAKYGHVGHLFQGPYQYRRAPTTGTVPLIARYIHLNPIRARLVKAPEDWRWSDFRRHLEGFGEGFLLPGYTEGGNLLRSLLPPDYVAFVRRGVTDIEAVRRILFDDSEEK